MLEYTQESIRELTESLVRIPSVSHTSQENTASEFIYDILHREFWFAEHPEYLYRIPVEQGVTGGLDRQAVLAFVPAGRPVKRTVLLNGHFDVVDTDVCGDLADLAFDAPAYTRSMADRNISEEAQKDFASGNWLFGRGVMDMKAGLALYMAFLAEKARHRDELAVNLLFLAVPDEEGNSVGMRGALSALCRFIRENSLELVAALSGEPAFWTSRTTEGSEPYRTLFTGTTGKILPMFFCIGREAHVGYAFDGVNAATLAAQVVCLMDSCPELIDGSGTDTLTPPVCLKLKDLRDVYSVTLPERAAAYINVLTVSHSPLDILNICRDTAKKALALVLDRIQEAGRRFQELSGRADSPVPDWAARVYTVSELLEQLASKQKGDSVSAHEAVNAGIRSFAAGLPASMDEREKGLAIADYLVSQCNLKGPAIIIGFLPPYYPQRLNRRKTENERNLRRIMEDVTAELQERTGAVRLVECFSGIMDLSYMGFQGEPKELDALADNMPGWDTIFSLPMEDLLSLDVPIASVGPAGKDAHKDTERLELEFSLKEAPRMLQEVIARLGEVGECQ